MEIGKFMRRAFNLYLDHPVIIIPFIFLGIINVVSSMWLENFMNDLLPALQSPTAFFLTSITGNLFPILLRLVVIILMFAILISLASSYIEAYSIGLARAMSTKKDISYKDGVSALEHGLSIFGVKLLVITILLLVAIGITIPLVILFKLPGVLLSVVVLLLFSASLMVITFFAPQCIVLEKKGSWSGIRGSYKFLKNNLESIAILLLFIFFAFIIFSVLQEVVITLSETFLSEYIVILISSGLHLLLFSMVFSPYVIILKTYFYFKKSR